MSSNQQLEFTPAVCCCRAGHSRVWNKAATIPGSVQNHVDVAVGIFLAVNMAVLGHWLDLMLLEFFSQLSDSVRAVVSLGKWPEAWRCCSLCQQGR